MTEKKEANKKIVIGVIVLVALIGVFAGIFFMFREKPTAGSKSIVMEVVNKEQEKVTYERKTDAEYLRQAMDEIDGFSYEATDGFIDTINGETADYSIDGSYWAIYVNGEYGQYGINEQPVKDGDVYRFAYTVYEE
ncbi:MAG: DUF4430 domain-containing protein [Clostridium sp.]|nr:DUF4430 domain-containing protein [Clostridium sp.]MCM1569483.1 DUF4430 domain-containing protein [Roseburia sp.]